MSTRREPQKKTGLERVGARVRQRAMSGTEASTVGFVLVLYVFAGAGLGYLADEFFETNWIVGAGVLAGSALGFREMFRMIKKISRIESRAKETTDLKPAPPAISPQREYSKERPATKSDGIEESETGIPARVFQVPPPPTASFDNPHNNPDLPR